MSWSRLKQTWTAELLLDLPVWDLLSLTTFSIKHRWSQNSWTEHEQLPGPTPYKSSSYLSFPIWNCRMWRFSLQRSVSCWVKLTEREHLTFPLSTVSFPSLYLLAKLSDCFSLCTEILLSTLIFNSLSINFLGRSAGSVSGLLDQ